MAIPVVLLVISVASVVSASAAERCPSFTNARASCTSSTCGRFVYKGSFIDNAAKKHRLASLPDGISLTPATSTPATCCNQCRQAGSCAFWSYNAATGLCILYEEDLCKRPAASVVDTASDASNVYNSKVSNSYVGGICIPARSKESLSQASKDVPEGLPERAFCLVSDKSLHINMLLGGYLDSRTMGASNLRGDKAVRTWIREVGISWVHKGRSHTLHMGARRGSEQDRGDGYLDFIKVDGTTLPKLALGDELNLFEGQAKVSFEAYEKTGPYDVDVYKVKIDDLLEAEMRLRIAHPLLQLEGDAEVHINMDILDLEYTSVVHGVLGQTYRADRLDQTLNYAALSDLMLGAAPQTGDKITIDSLDGTVNSYVSSSVTAPDCAFTQFQSAKKGNKGAASAGADGEGGAKTAEAVAISAS